MNRLEVTTIEMKIGFINKRSRYDQERIQVVLSNVQDLFGRLADGKNLTNVSVSIDDQGFDDQGAKNNTMHIHATVEDAWKPTYIGRPQDAIYD